MICYKWNVMHLRCSSTSDVNISLIKMGPKYRAMNNNSPCPIMTWNYDNNIAETWPQCNVYNGCGKYQPGSNGTNNLQWLCIEWSQTSNACSKVCQSKVKNPQGTIQSIKDKEAIMNGNHLKIEEVVLIPFFSPLDKPKTS